MQSNTISIALVKSCVRGLDSKEVMFNDNNLNTMFHGKQTNKIWPASTKLKLQATTYDPDNVVIPYLKIKRKRNKKKKRLRRQLCVKALSLFPSMKTKTKFLYIFSKEI